MNEVLRSSGHPLDAETRAFMEPKFGRDFSHVRVHTDASAAESARAVQALAWTVDNHVTFASARYSPASSAGRRLLAHELAHVAQQSAGLQRASISPPPRVEMSPNDDELEREARDSAERLSKDEDAPTLHRARAGTLRRVPAIVGFDEAGPKASLAGGERERQLFECFKKSGPDPNECDPAGALTWANFTAAPRPGAFGAETTASITEADVPSQKCLELVYNKTTGPMRRLQAKFDPAKSWGRSSARSPADPARNGCAQRIAECKTFHLGEAAARRTGATFSMSSTPNPSCPAAITARGAQAKSAAECDTILAKDCLDQAVAESMRLLRHEQGHFDLTCALTKKANVALATGKTIAELKAALNTKLGPTQAKYETETHNGCNAAPQTSWEGAIARGLPAITLP